jgi:hypothetical protein
MDAGMSSSLRALLAGIIDYAGLFPPARLPLEQAIGNYGRYRRQANSWMLGRFICPAGRLTDLAKFHDELFSEGPPFAFSLLGTGAAAHAEFLTSMRADLQAIAAFRTRHGSRITADAFEVRLTPELQTRSDFARLLHDLAVLFGAQAPPVLTPFYEISLGADWVEAMTAVVAAMSDAGLSKVQQTPGSGAPGFKLRCGGLEPSAFPSPEQVASALTLCRDCGVPFKGTAGLHHPMRHFDRELQVPMHGFINVFAAGVLAHARKLGVEQVREIIADENAENFVCEEETFGWKGLRATTKEIAAARRQMVISFGSCSFEEPVDDLRALGWL